MMSFLFYALAYLLGSLPFGYILTRVTRKTDIRDFGSGNIGATNVLRVYGWKTALPVFVLDLAKGFLPVFLAAYYTGHPPVYLAAGFLAMFGHSFSLYLKFKGGKAVATTIGVLLAVSPHATMLFLACFVLVVFFTRYVSVGSIVSTLLLPLFFLALGFSLNYILFGVAAAVLVTGRHHENIGRLLKGKESKIGKKR